MTEIKQLAEKYLSEYLPGHNQDLIDNKLYTMTISAMAGFADSLANPSLKPLSELYKDREACADLLCFVFGYHNADQLEIINHGFKTEIHDYSNKVSIWFDGAFYKYRGSKSIGVPIFQIVDLLRSLGYDVQPEKSMIKSHNETIKCPECAHI